jgi:8-oxo-dGTP pyrophosphatase MutT (NUDIX family)
MPSRSDQLRASDARRRFRQGRPVETVTVSAGAVGAAAERRSIALEPLSWRRRDTETAGAVRTVGALLLDGQDRILLGLRAGWKATWPRCWDCIGGRVEAGETLDVALAREVREEIGVTPTAFRLLGAVPEQRPDLYGQALHHIYLVTDWDGGAPDNVCDEHSEIRWFDIESLAALSNLADRDYHRLIQGMRQSAPWRRTHPDIAFR